MRPLLLALLIGASPSPRVRALVKESIRAYNAGDFDLALKDAQRAYEQSGLPGLLYNLGQCHRALKHWDSAAFNYRAYLREKPDAPNRAEVERLIAEMDAKAKEPAASAPTPAPSTPILVEAPAAAVTAPPPAKTSRPGGLTWGLGATGVGALVAATVLAVVAQGALGNDHPTVVNGLTLHHLAPGAYVAAQNEAAAADVLWAVGGAFAVGALVSGFTGH